MAIYARVPESKYVLAPEGLHAAVCCDVVDLGLVDTQFGRKPKVAICWQLEEAIDTDRGRIRPVVRQRFTNSLHEKAKLRGVLETWRGGKFTRDDLRGFDLEKLIGESCQVQVIHNVSDEGQTFANVNTVIPLGKGMPRVSVDPGYVRRSLRDAQPTHPSTSPADDGLEEDPIPF